MKPNFIDISYSNFILIIKLWGENTKLLIGISLFAFGADVGVEKSKKGPKIMKQTYQRSINLKLKDVKADKKRIKSQEGGDLLEYKKCKETHRER